MTMEIYLVAIAMFIGIFTLADIATRKEVNNMSLNWNFEKDFIGVAFRRDGKPEFIYKGNALMIFNAEYPWRGWNGENEPIEGEWGYSLCNFYTDKDHLRNCIKDKVYEGDEYRKIILIPCPEAYTFIKEIKGLWPVEITNRRTEFMMKLREKYRKVGYNK